MKACVDLSLHKLQSHEGDRVPIDRPTKKSCTCHSQDKDFPDVSAFHRRALFAKLGFFRQSAASRQLKEIEKKTEKKKADLTGYTSVKIRKKKAALTMGEKDEIKIYRSTC